MRLADQSTRATIRTLTILAAATSLLLTLITPFVGTARAGHDKPFTLDGTPDTGATYISDKCGQTNEDDQAKGGTKLDTIHEDSPPVIVESSMTPKDDFCDFWVDSEVDSHGDVWLYAAFRRATTGGTAHVAIELLNEAADCNVQDYANCNPWENRDAGTRIIGFTWQGNDGLVDPKLWTFNGSFTITDLTEFFDGGTFEGGAFGEIRVNLSAAGVLLNVNNPDADCQLIAAVIPMTLPGLSLGSQPKDVVLGSVPPIETCGSLKVIKSVTGGDDFGDEFPITVGGPGTSDHDSSDLSDDLGHNGSFTVDELKERSDYTITEDLSGLTGWSIDSIVCDDGSSSGEGVTFLSGIKVVAGETTTCTVTNSPTLPTLTIVKQVINDDGGTMDADEFPVRRNGTLVNLTDVTPPDQGYDSQASWSDSVSPGTHTITEDNVDGYELVSITCVGDGVDNDNSATVDLGLGDSATCTVINDDDPGELILIKDIDDEDDLYPDVDEDDFTPTIDGEDADWGSNAVDAGTYTVDEDDTVGPLADGTFVQTSIVCDGQETDQVTVGNGETKTCTITNMAIGAGLTVIKQVQNNWGGELTAADFPLTVNGDPVTSGIATSFPAGTYTIAETKQDGYELADTYCTRNNVDIDGISGESFDITVVPGQTVVCTFVNRDVPGSLTINKTVVNDDGGTATQAAFTPTLDGEETDWGSQNETKNGQTGIDWGTYTIGEDDLPVGYTMADIDCGNFGSLDGDDDTVDVTIGAGDTVVCTITNDDQPATLTLVKTVVNTGGGTLGADDFQARLNGNDVDWSTPIQIPAGDHTASEQQRSGYQASPWGGDCAANGTFTAALGGSYTCTITNTFIPPPPPPVNPTVTLVKTVDNTNGGTLEASDFPVFVNDNQVSWGVAITVPPGEHVMSETQQPGYLAGPWGGDCAADGTLTTVADTNYTCTITNTALPAGLTIVKDVLIGDLDASEFPLLITDADGLTQTVTSGQAITLPAGTYTIGEEQQEGYELVDITCDNGVTLAEGEDTVSVTVGLDETVVCTIVNAEVFVLPIVVEPEPEPEPAPVDVLPAVEELPATGLDTMRLALLSALIAALGALFLLGTSPAPTTGRRRRD